MTVTGRAAQSIGMSKRVCSFSARRIRLREAVPPRPGSVMSPARAAGVGSVALCLTSFKLVFPGCFLSSSEESAVCSLAVGCAGVPRSRCPSGAGGILGTALLESSLAACLLLPVPASPVRLCLSWPLPNAQKGLSSFETGLYWHSQSCHPPPMSAWSPPASPVPCHAALAQRVPAPRVTAEPGPGEPLAQQVLGGGCQCPGAHVGGPCFGWPLSAAPGGPGAGAREGRYPGPGGC